MKDLVLPDDHGIAADRDGHRVPNRLLAGQRPTARRDHRREALDIIGAREVGLHSVAGLQRECSASQFAVKCSREPLTLDRGDVTCMGDERDDRKDRKSVV